MIRCKCSLCHIVGVIGGLNRAGESIPERQGKRVEQRRGTVHTLARMRDETRPAGKVARKPEDDERILSGEIGIGKPKQAGKQRHTLLWLPQPRKRETNLIFIRFPSVCIAGLMCNIADPGYYPPFRNARPGLIKGNADTI